MGNPIRRSLLVLALLAGGAPVQAGDSYDLELGFAGASQPRGSKAIVRSSAVGRAPAPFVARDPLPEMLLAEEQDRSGGQGSCARSAADLCYDRADGRVVYRPARQYMPRIDGLTPESVSLRRDRIVFKYSF